VSSLFFILEEELRALLLSKGKAGKFSFVEGLLNEAGFVLCRTGMK